ncbi:hypothetical protein L1887_51969 [Cichorium endivia]|nr:hypothetical protein L1887_51969 [Cichorium endivia]
MLRPTRPSPRSSSLLPSRAVVSQYQQKPCLTKMLEFCSILPDWYRLQALLRSYLWNVDWKFLITCQDALETQMHDLWLRVISPAKSCDPYAEVYAFDGRHPVPAGGSLASGSARQRARRDDRVDGSGRHRTKHARLASGRRDRSANQARGRRKRPCARAF